MTEIGERAARELAGGGCWVIAARDEEAAVFEQWLDVKPGTFAPDAEVKVDIRGAEIAERDQRVDADDAQMGSRRIETASRGIQAT